MFRRLALDATEASPDFDGGFLPNANPKKEQGAGFRGGDLYVFDSLPSTNDHLKSNHAQYGDGDVVWALEQLKGRGRHSRPWHSGEAKQNLAFSVLFRDATSGGRESLASTLELSLVAGLAVASSLESWNLHPRLKWPNDVLVEGKKISGVLVERFFLQEEVVSVLGVGINVAGDGKFLESIDVAATSVWEASKKNPSLREVFDAFGTWMRAYESLFEGSGEGIAEPLIEPLKKYADLIGLSVRYMERGKVAEGVVRSIGSNGLLMGSPGGEAGPNSNPAGSARVVPLKKCLI